jgi:signal transduction histidine kinase
MPMSARAEFLSALMRLESLPPEAPPTTLELAMEIGDTEARFRLTLSWIADGAQVCLCADDVTEERNLQKKIVQQEKDVLLESLLGGIAHELNNKALPLLGFSELLADEAARLASPEGCDPAKIAGYTEVLQKSSAEFAAVVHQLLQLVKPSGAKAQSLDLRQAVREAAALLAFPLHDAGITVIEQFPDEAIHVTADENQIKQIVVNLALNAIDALHPSFQKELVFRVRTGNGQAFLDLADTGPGIAPEILPRIFDPFFTSKSAETARGLGLSVSRSLARQNQGEIGVESKPGEGSTFTLRLPLALFCVLSVPAPAPVAAAAELPPPPAAPASPAAHPPTILVVDDEENVGGLVQEVLRRKFKGEVFRARNGAEGIAEIEARDLRGDAPFDLIVSDVRMPVKNGLELFRWLAKQRPALVPHFFFMTGHDGTNEMSDEIGRSNVPVLRKPFAITALIELCQARMSEGAKAG